MALLRKRVRQMVVFLSPLDLVLVVIGCVIIAQILWEHLIIILQVQSVLIRREGAPAIL
jgi:hypothetical protein